MEVGGVVLGVVLGRVSLRGRLICNDNMGYFTN